MPRFDGTGPWGDSPASGRGLGPCGRGGWRRGYGRRRFFGFRPRITEVEEKELLENEVTNLEEELKEIKARLNELNK